MEYVKIYGIKELIWVPSVVAQKYKNHIPLWLLGYQKVLITSSHNQLYITN